MSGKIFIYGLIDPRNSKIMYIGRTKDMRRRLYQHTHDFMYAKDKSAWIKELLDIDLLPQMILFEECTRESAIDREQFWIDKISSEQGMLLNRWGAGVGNFEHSPEARKHISDALIGRAPTFLGKKHTKETRRLIIEKNRVLSSDEVHQIRQCLSENNEVGYSDLGKTFGVSDVTIRNISKGKGYEEVVEDDRLQDKIDSLREKRGVVKTIRFTDEEVREMRQLNKSGMTIRAIMKIFNASHGAIWMAVNRRRYKWVE